MLDFPVSWLVFALAADVRVLLVFGFPRWCVRHRDASAPPALASVRVHRLPVHAAISPSAHCSLNSLMNRCAYFMSCWQDLLVHGLLISFVHRVWIVLPQVTALRKRDGSRICHFFPMQHTGLPWFCTSCPQSRAQRRHGPGIVDTSWQPRGWYWPEPLTTRRRASSRYYSVRYLRLIRRIKHPQHWPANFPACGRPGIAEAHNAGRRPGGRRRCQRRGSATPAMLRTSGPGGRSRLPAALRLMGRPARPGLARRARWWCAARTTWRPAGTRPRRAAPGGSRR